MQNLRKANQFEVCLFVFLIVQRRDEVHPGVFVRGREMIRQI